MITKIPRPSTDSLDYNQINPPRKNNFIFSFIFIIILIFAIIFYISYFNEQGFDKSSVSNSIYALLNLKYWSNFIEAYNGILSYFHPTETTNSLNITIENESNLEQKQVIESNELHWEYMPVSFNFSNSEDCGEFQTYRILRAFAEISNATLGKISFIQINSTANITIICHKTFLPPTEPGLLQSGETTTYNIGSKVISAQVNFYNTAGDNYNGGCRNYPDVEIHEILHTFGLKHTDAPYNIMNPIGSYCPTKINQDIIDKLMSIYG